MNAANPKDILVITTSSVDGLKIKKYLRPVSTHIVAGTNLFTDGLAGWTDVFGGRSKSYQKQLTALYNEAIGGIKNAAYEIGANCVIGLSIDMDEISGKGKSMFMLTAVGTAVILEREAIDKGNLPRLDKKFENVGVERVNTLRDKKKIIEHAVSGKLVLSDEVWNFITANQVDEVFPYLLKEFVEVYKYDTMSPGTSDKYYNLFLGYIDALPDNRKLELLYSGIKETKNEKIVQRLSQAIRDLNLFVYNKNKELFQAPDFEVNKKGLVVVTHDKPFYNKQDINDLQAIRELIQNIFIERGTRAMKKQMLSSKETEVWDCECGRKANDIGSNCTRCEKDIYGFLPTEVKPKTVDDYIKQKIELITEFVA